MRSVPFGSFLFTPFFNLTSDEGWCIIIKGDAPTQPVVSLFSKINSAILHQIVFSPTTLNFYKDKY
jgi:hypothetical protein